METTDREPMKLHSAFSDKRKWWFDHLTLFFELYLKIYKRCVSLLDQGRCIKRVADESVKAAHLIVDVKDTY